MKMKDLSQLSIGTDTVYNVRIVLVLLYILIIQNEHTICFLTSETTLISSKT